jgi:hypothetical protein
MKRMSLLTFLMMGLMFCPCVYAWSSLSKSIASTSSTFSSSCDTQVSLNEQVLNDLVASVDCVNADFVAGAMVQAGIGQMLPSKYQGMLDRGDLDVLVSAGAVRSVGVQIRF